jgi:hypothetical protein
VEEFERILNFHAPLPPKDEMMKELEQIEMKATGLKG